MFPVPGFEGTNYLRSSDWRLDEEFGGGTYNVILLSVNE